MICSKCHENKPESEFYKGNRKNGWAYWCKSCVRENHLIFRRGQELFRKYGITESQYRFLLQKQGFKCGNPRCEVYWIDYDGNFDVDHDHKTGRIRGLLCSNCNKSVGFAKESTDILEGLIEYLRKEGE